MSSAAGKAKTKQIIFSDIKVSFFGAVQLARAQIITSDMIHIGPNNTNSQLNHGVSDAKASQAPTSKNQSVSL